MDIEEIYDGCLYSVVFEGEQADEYSRALAQWNDLDYLVDFFKSNASYINTPFWIQAGLNHENPVKSARRVVEESNALALHIRDLAKNVSSGKIPDLETYFKPLGGKYACVRELEPHKSYGVYSPSLLRLYAIRLDTNVYLIVYGSIKLAKTIQDSPGLNHQVFNRIDAVIAFLKANGILGSDDI